LKDGQYNGQKKKDNRTNNDLNKVWRHQTVIFRLCFWGRIFIIILWHWNSWVKFSLVLFFKTFQQVYLDHCLVRVSFPSLTICIMASRLFCDSLFLEFVHMSYLRLVDLSTDCVDSKLFYYLKFKLIKFIAFPIFSQFTPFTC
jgi:hypothetical protein